MRLVTYRTPPEPGYPSGRIVDPDGNDLDPKIVLPQIDREIAALQARKAEVEAVWARIREEEGEEGSPLSPGAGEATVPLAGSEDVNADVVASAPSSGRGRRSSE